MENNGKDGQLKKYLFLYISTQGIHVCDITNTKKKVTVLSKNFSGTAYMVKNVAYKDERHEEPHISSYDFAAKHDTISRLLAPHKRRDPATRGKRAIAALAIDVMSSDSYAPSSHVIHRFYDKEYMEKNVKEIQELLEKRAGIKTSVVYQ